MTQPIKYQNAFDLETSGQTIITEESGVINEILRFQFNYYVVNWSTFNNPNAHESHQSLSLKGYQKDPVLRKRSPTVHKVNQSCYTD